MKKRKGNFICPKCKYVIGTCHQKHLAYCDGSGPRKYKKRLSKSEATKKLWENDNYRNKVVDSLKNVKFESTGLAKTEEKEIERREKIRTKILKRYEDGWQPKAGRCKKIKYESQIAGIITVDGSWELKVVQYLDSLGVTWRRNKTRFKYLNLENKISHYTPDFYVEEWNAYIEIKGYETDLDRCKWKQFEEKLIVWKKKELKDLKII